MNIDIISVGSIKEKYFVDAINEYLKRMKPYANVRVIEISEHKLPNNPSESQIQIGIEKEKEDILSKISDRAFICSLCIEGKQLDSESLSSEIEKIGINGYSDITFIIGGSYGLSNEIKQKSHLKLSFSKMTFPHQLMRVILLEQVYRAYRIMRNEPYHK